MVKKLALVMAFLTAVSIVSVATPDSAEARRGWRRPYVSYYYGRPRNYRYSRGYYGPRFYRPYYYSYPRSYYYGYPGAYYYGYPGYYPRGGVSFSIGF